MTHKPIYKKKDFLTNPELLSMPWHQSPFYKSLILNSDLSDTEKAITNLANYANEIQINKKVKILKYFKIFEKLNLSKIILIIYNLTENKIIKNLNSTNPKICLFQFYKLGLLIRQIKKLKKSQ